MKLKIILCILLLLSLLNSACQNQTNSTKDKHRILVILPLTGPGAELGQSSRIGMQLSLEDIANRGEQINIDLVFQDSKTEPKTALSIFASRDLYSKERLIISGMSGVTRALVEPSKEAKVLLLATLVGVPNIGSGSPYFIRVNVMSDAIAPPLARFAATKYKEMASLYLDDDYGKANFELFKKTYETNSGKIIFSEVFSNQPSNSRLLVDKVIRSGAKACFIAGYGPTYISLFKSFKEFAPHIQLFADIGLVNTPIFRAVGHAAEGVYVSATLVDEYPPTTTEAKRFLERYIKASGSARPDYVTAYSYDTIRVLNNAFISVPDGNPEKIRQYLLKQQFKGFGGNFKFDPLTGDSLYEDLPIFIIKDGSIVRVKNQK